MRRLLLAAVLHNLPEHCLFIVNIHALIDLINHPVPQTLFQQACLMGKDSNIEQYRRFVMEEDEREHDGEEKAGLENVLKSMLHRKV